MRSNACCLLLLAIPGWLTAQTSWDTHARAGEALAREGRPDAAATEFNAALVEAQALGESDWRLPLTLHNLGAVERDLGRYLEAERHYQRAVAIWESRHPQRVLELSNSLQNLGALHLVMGRLLRAEPFFRRAYELRLRCLGPADPQAGASLAALANLAQERRRYAEADDLYRQAAAILEHASDPLRAAGLWHNWGLLNRDRHRDAEARPLLERAAAAYEQAAPDHPRTAIVLRNLAELEAAAGNRARAAELFERAVTICEKSLPAEHPQTGIILQAYARFLTQSKRKAEAKPIATRAAAILAKSPATYTVDVSAWR